MVAPVGLGLCCCAGWEETVSPAGATRPLLYWEKGHGLDVGQTDTLPAATAFQVVSDEVSPLPPFLH